MKHTQRSPSVPRPPGSSAPASNPEPTLNVRAGRLAVFEQSTLSIGIDNDDSLDR